MKILSRSKLVSAVALSLAAFAAGAQGRPLPPPNCSGNLTHG
jgi:hypothetical protein